MKDIRLLPPATEIAETVHQVLVYEHRGALQDVADLLEIPYTTVHSQLTGQARTLPWDTVRAAHFVTLSRRLERYLAWPGLRIVKASDGLNPGKCLPGEVADISDAAGALRQQALEFAKDGQYDPSEIAEMENGLDKVERELNEVRAILTYLKRPRPAKE